MNLDYSFLIMSKKLMEDREIFEDHLLLIFLQISQKDPVSNVKILLAHLIRDHYLHKGCLIENDKFQSMYKCLKSDPDEEIQYLF